MLIEVNIPRPLTLLLGIVAVVGWFMWWSVVQNGSGATGTVSEQSSSSSAAVGGVSPEATLQAVEAEEKAFFARKVHATLEKQEELLRFQLNLLEEEQQALDGQLTEAQEEEFIAARTNLIKLLQDKKAAEQQIRDALYQLWDAREQAARVSVNTAGPIATLTWPLDPIYGISATFRDADYVQQFGFQHNGTDFPALQGTPISAAADGVVEKAVDNGLGYSYIIIKHSGIVTLYGHISSIEVVEGQSVRAGEFIGLSGGRPGSPGAGKHTTGPHLHFETLINGEHVDPMQYLPPSPLL